MKHTFLLKNEYEQINVKLVIRVKWKIKVESANAFFLQKKNKNPHHDSQARVA